MHLVRPSASEIAARLAVTGEPFTYPEVNQTWELDAEREAALVPKYVVDRYAFPVGSGRAAFEAAARALFEWRHFQVPWIETFGMDVPAEPLQRVATLARVAGFWFLNPCRVVSALPLAPGSSAAGFSYGTLAGHAESGEEEFRVRLDSATGEVVYEIVAFSRPAVWAVRLANPFARRLQRRFAAASAEALARAVVRAAS